MTVHQIARDPSGDDPRASMRHSLYDFSRDSECVVERRINFKTHVIQSPSFESFDDKTNCY